MFAIPLTSLLNITMFCMWLLPCQNIMKYLQSEAREKQQAAFQKGWKITIIKVTLTPDLNPHAVWFAWHPENLLYIGWHSWCQSNGKRCSLVRVAEDKWIKDSQHNVNDHSGNITQACLQDQLMLVSEQILFLLYLHFNSPWQVCCILPPQGIPQQKNDSDCGVFVLEVRLFVFFIKWSIAVSPVCLSSPRLLHISSLLRL